LDGLPAPMRDAVLDAIDLTRDNDKLVLTLAFDYGGRQELISAIRRMMADGIPPDLIDDDTIARYLFTCDLPDPDLIIRTSGEYRLSNFLVWQSAYSELYFSPVLWPEFGPGDLEDAVRDFSQRERRFGNISADAARVTRESE
jgi:undecaprenyl diphosphate synthase